MRITEGMIAGDFLYNVNKSRQNIARLQVDLASGKRVRTVSDNPAGSDVILRLNAGIDRNAQYQKNVADAQGSLAGSGSSLDALGTLLQEAQEIIVESTDGQQASAMSVLAERLDQIINEALSMANTQFNGRYLFGGTQTTAPPYELVTNPGPPVTQSVVYHGDAETIRYATGDSSLQQVSVPGSQAFGGTALFDGLIRARDSIRGGTSPTAETTTAVANALKTVTETAGLVGTLTLSLDSTTIHLEDQRMQLMVLLSAEQDTDVAEATLNLKQQETMLDYALQTGAQILPKSLLDFLS